jgi:hypothetical protein
MLCKMCIILCNLEKRQALASLSVMFITCRIRMFSAWLLTFLPSALYVVPHCSLSPHRLSVHMFTSYYLHIWVPVFCFGFKCCLRQGLYLRRTWFWFLLSGSNLSLFVSYVLHIEINVLYLLFLIDIKQQCLGYSFCRCVSYHGFHFFVILCDVFHSNCKEWVMTTEMCHSFADEPQGRYILILFPPNLLFLYMS